MHSQGEVNLVPMVDMMSTLVAFLLLTAVWTNMRAFPTQHGGDGGALAPRDEARLILSSTGALLAAGDADPQTLTRDEIPAALDGLGVGPLVVAAQPGVPYGDVITTLDLAATRGIAVSYGTPR